jgi:hypothetical protein
LAANDSNSAGCKPQNGRANDSGCATKGTSPARLRSQYSDGIVAACLKRPTSESGHSRRMRSRQRLSLRPQARPRPNMGVGIQRKAHPLSAKDNSRSSDPRTKDQAVAATASKSSCLKSVARISRARQCATAGFQLGVTRDQMSPASPLCRTGYALRRSFASASQELSARLRSTLRVIIEHTY